ncbi:hypothetical protein S245_071771, partial [Arachis hypogaea]
SLPLLFLSQPNCEFHRSLPASCCEFPSHSPSCANFSSLILLLSSHRLLLPVAIAFCSPHLPVVVRSSVLLPSCSALRSLSSPQFR